MGMTIDTVNRWLEIQRIQRHNMAKSSDLIGDKKTESLDTAISYLEDYQRLSRKYAKINEIIQSWKNGTIEEKDSIYAFHKILEVVEDEEEEDY